MYDGQRPLQDPAQSTKKPYQVGKNPYLQKNSENHKNQYLHQFWYKKQKNPCFHTGFSAVKK